jgi:DNA-binding winged helix-turn-helix (wHTH) protein/predicted ATPase
VEADYLFPPFRLDPQNEQVWEGTRLVPLRPQVFAVLQYLVTHPGRLITTDELLRALWPGIHVHTGLLKSYLYRLRKALREEAATPHFIETVARRGCRFIAPVTRSPTGPQDSPPILPASPTIHATAGSLEISPYVGRQDELAHLHQWWHAAVHGHRHFVLVTGEPGIGKTALVETFVRQVEAADDGIAVTHGYCIEHYGSGEAYLPVLDAIGRLCRAPWGSRVVALLRHYAPTWLLQFPAFVAETEMESLVRKSYGTTKERMLREIADALEAMALERPIILVLEDLQWSDTATLDLLAVLARRRDPARLLLIGTYRPVDVILSGHPLRAVTQELLSHQYAVTLPLGTLTEADVHQYLAVRFPHHAFPPASGETLYRKTDGNPFFLVTMVNELVIQGVLFPVDETWRLNSQSTALVLNTPDSVRQLLKRQIDQVSATAQDILAAASVVGATFSAAEVAAGVQQALEVVEATCDQLAQRGQILATHGVETFPNGVTAGRYGFVHSLYQNALYEQLPPAGCMRLHQRIGACQETLYAQEVGERAAELALHFTRGQDVERAVHYYELAARTALQRSAYRETIDAATHALDALHTLPDTPARISQELSLQLTMGVALMNTQGFTAPQAEQTYARASALCQACGDTPHLLPALWGLRAFYNVRAELDTAHALAQRSLALAKKTRTPALLLEGHLALGMSYFYRGDPLAARKHLERSRDLYDPQQHHGQAVLYGQDPGVLSLCHLGWVLWGLGYPEAARESAAQAVTLATAREHPFSLAYALCFAAAVHRERGEVAQVYQHADTAVTLAGSHGFVHFRAMGLMLRGWALTRQGQSEDGIAQMQEALAVQHAIGARIGRSYYLALLAEGLACIGQHAQGCAAVEDALSLVRQTGEGYYEAELYRLRGQLVLTFQPEETHAKALQPTARRDKRSDRKQVQHHSQAEVYFEKALAIARGLHAKSLELRSAISVSRLWQQRGKHREARVLLAGIYGWFTEGFETKDLQEAKALLDTLS